MLQNVNHFLKLVGGLLVLFCYTDCPLDVLKIMISEDNVEQFPGNIILCSLNS